MIQEESSKWSTNLDNSRKLEQIEGWQPRVHVSSIASMTFRSGPTQSKDKCKVESRRSVIWKPFVTYLKLNRIVIWAVIAHISWTAGRLSQNGSGNHSARLSLLLIKMLLGYQHGIEMWEITCFKLDAHTLNTLSFLTNNANIHTHNLLSSQIQ